jgi:hypothetical protein
MLRRVSPHAAGPWQHRDQEPSVSILLQPHAHGEPRDICRQCAGDALQLLLDQEGSEHGPLGVVDRSWRWQGEDGHDTVTGELTDDAAKVFDTSGHMPQIVVKASHELFWFGGELLGKSCETAQVTKEDHHILPLTPEFALPGMIEEEVHILLANEPACRMQEPRLLEASAQHSFYLLAQRLDRRRIQGLQCLAQQMRRLLVRTVGHTGPGVPIRAGVPSRLPNPVVSAGSRPALPEKPRPPVSQNRVQDVFRL